MTNTILDALIVHLPSIYNSPGMTAADPLYLRSVVKAPLQDDPTLRAFYLEVGPDTTMSADDNHWRMPVQSIRRGKLGVDQDKPAFEVGGGYKMINFFLIKGWLTMTGSRELAHENAGRAIRLMERAFATLANRQLFIGLTTDDGMETTNAGYPQVFNLDGMHYELKGGETEWYPQLSMRFHVYSEIKREYWA